jgi:hypothetical protein
MNRWSMDRRSMNWSVDGSSVDALEVDGSLVDGLSVDGSSVDGLR